MEESRIFLVIGLPFKTEYTRPIILACCTKYDIAKALKEQVLSQSTFFLDVTIDVYEIDYLNSFYL